MKLANSKSKLTPTQRYWQNYWKKNQDKLNAKNLVRYHDNKEVINRKRREKYHQQDLGFVNKERRRNNWLQKKEFNNQKIANNSDSDLITKTFKPLRVPPTWELINQVWNYIVARPPKRGEQKKSLLECLFLLGWKVGLRVSEAISFDYRLVNPEPRYKNLFRINGKAKKPRWVYIHPEIITELEKRNWEPHQGNRFTFHRFLQQIKKEMNIAENIELAPHTLRRHFATYNAMNGMPLPVLQKILGHARISTTAIYVKDVDLENLVKYKPI